MRLIDSHSHIYQEDFDTDLEEVIARAREAGVERVFMPNIDQESVGRMHRLEEAFPAYCVAMMGLHPTSVKEDFREQLARLHDWFTRRHYVAVGEIGIDLYWDKTFLKEQQEAFETQLAWSIDLNLPVVIHNRDAFQEVMQSIERVGAKRLRGVFHSFGGNREELEAVLSLEHFYVGINGVLTFKNAKLAETLETCPIEKIVLETDAPYLTPVPYRGKRNEPAYMLHTANRLAEVFGLSPEEIGEQTSRNTESLFGYS